MGMTMTQKILAAHAGLESVTAGQLIRAKLDLVLGNDITTPVAINEFTKNGFSEVFDKDKIAIVLDHFASDDNNSAVVADLGYGDYVITTSSSPVKSGDQVRMAESNG